MNIITSTPPPHTPPPPLVSIIIPIYNVEKYLQQCLESICNQTLQEIEIICVNDGSTDNSRNIAYEYAHKDSRICIIDSENQGLSSARNQGLARARAEYIQFLDADDYVEPTISSMMYNIMYMYNVDVVMCGIETHYEEGQEYRNKKQIDAYYTKEKQGVYPIDIESISYTLASVCVKMIKKSLLDTYNIRFVERRVYEDNYFTPAYLSVANNIYFLPDKLYHRRLRNDSITDRALRGYSDARMDLFYQLERLFYFWMNNNRWTTEYAVYFWMYYSMSIYESLVKYPHISLSDLYSMVDRFVRRKKRFIPHIVELQETRSFLSQFLGYEV